MAATAPTALTSAVPQRDEETAWLLSLASPNENTLALQTKAAAKDAAREAVSRCAKIIKSTDVDIYRRGMAVLALGRTLAREMGRSPQIPEDHDSFTEVVRNVSIVGARRMGKEVSFRHAIGYVPSVFCGERACTARIHVMALLYFVHAQRTPAFLMIPTEIYSTMNGTQQDRHGDDRCH